MARKFGKFLLFTAAVGSAAAAVYYFMKKESAKEIVDEDYDDFSDDSEAESESSRSYVSLNPEDASAESADEKEEVPEKQEPGSGK